MNMAHANALHHHQCLSHAYSLQYSAVRWVHQYCPVFHIHPSMVWASLQP